MRLNPVLSSNILTDMLCLLRMLFSSAITSLLSSSTAIGENVFPQTNPMNSSNKNLLNKLISSNAELSNYLPLTKSIHHPTNRKRTFFSNTLQGMRIYTNKKTRRMWGLILIIFFLKDFACLPFNKFK